ncbi:MAG: NTF2-like N-terminal transpeptidase domain-containing protein, partial [Tissierella sp.]|uniref:NTF2-like N-terminal transpeptidase domain-containing protein n=1 Tax=Tissierella sp. TaxID=41274 RepID=UPI003F981DB6
MKRKKILMLLFTSIMTMLIFTACTSQTAEDRFKEYKEAWEDKDYQTMYSMISKDSKEHISKDDFIDRYTNIFDGIGAKDIDIKIKEDGEGKENILFTLKMDTLAGEVLLDTYQVKMIKEKGEDKKNWFIDWSESLIFPQMEKEDSVRVGILGAKRGEIYDRNGKGLAINGSRYSVGIYPAEYEDINNEKLTNLLDIDEEMISDKLSRNKDPEHFIPIVKIPLEDKEKLNKLLEIKGVISQEVEERVYPGGEAFGSLIGYIKPITAEELEEDEDDIYHNTSRVGKFGLETVYEKELRPNDGKEIYISKVKDGQELEKIVLAKTEAKDGKDLNVNIDIDLQKKIYDELDGEVGTSTAIDPKTGQVLAMVSSPSFDSNL